MTPPSAHAQQKDAVEAALGRRRLIWFGTRGSDAEPLLDYHQFSGCFSLVAPINSVALSTESCLETIQQVRVDLNAYDTDTDTSEAARELHRQLVLACGEPAAIAAYRPAAFLSSAYFPRSEHVQYLGLFHEHQAMFEHKPWVEMGLRQAGVRVVPWRYLGDEDLERLEEWARAGPCVLRVNRSSGGAGVSLLRNFQELAAQWPSHQDGFLSVAPYLEPNIPVNVNACVFPDGAVTIHGPSLQLIGIACCTSRSFGYCGNDFALIRDLDPQVLDALEEMTITCGAWLHSKSYIGAFGLDALIYEGKVYLTEINPRFQGSSRMAARLATELDLPDIFADHMAAFLGLPGRRGPRLRELASAQRPVAQVIVHNRSRHSAWRRQETAEHPIGQTPLLLPQPGVEVVPEAILFKLEVDGPVTSDGQDLTGDLGAVLEGVATALFTFGSAPTASTVHLEAAGRP